jgi:alpha-ketoglutaric semialdehyde dehydrogenase
MMTETSLQPVLIAGQWRPADAAGSFHAENPATGDALPDAYPISRWADCDAALAAAAEAAPLMRATAPERIADFLTRYAARIEAQSAAIVEMAHHETGLPRAPRLAEVELPRTTGQLRQAAAAILDGAWALPTIDTKLNLRSCLEPIGPVWVIGPNNFPFAYNGVAGGDFASAIAAGNPVIAKAHPSHPGTTRLLAVEAAHAVAESGLPAAAVQMIYHVENEDGLRLMSDPRLAALGFTGSRAGGLKLKAAADAAGKPAYLEMSSLNPVVILPGALVERGAEVAGEFAASCLAACGQMCTKPGIAVLFAGPDAGAFLATVKEKFDAASPAPLLSAGVARSLAHSVGTLQDAGASVITGGAAKEGPGYRFANTLLAVTGAQFLVQPQHLQTEAFGNATLCVVVDDAAQAEDVLRQLEGNLTSSLYSSRAGSDDPLYARLAPILRTRAGRLLNDKMPTGVAVNAAMNHGGPYPATGHPGFTAVGFPAALRRFAMLASYDNVRPARLPLLLRDQSPNPQLCRLIDGAYRQGDIG